MAAFPNRLNLTTSDFLSLKERQEIVSIWNEAYPVNLQYKDVGEFEQYLLDKENIIHYLLNNDKGEIIAWLSVFDRDDERWLAILIKGSWQKMGIGGLLLDKAKGEEAHLNGWVVDHNDYLLDNGENYLSPINFYLNNGFVINDQHRLDNEKISCVRVRWSK